MGNLVKVWADSAEYLYGTSEYAIIPKPILESKSSPMPQQANAPLPEDFLLENYRIGKQLSSGGFSLVYLGYDEYGDEVAIKEYLPASLAMRKEGQVKPAIGEENLTTFRYGMK